MEALARWMPLVVVAAILFFATFNARRLRRRLGHSPVTVFQSRSGVERARAWLVVVGFCVLAATGPWPALAGAPGLDGAPWMRAAGLGALLAAPLCVLLGSGALGSSWRIGVDEQHPTELVTRGVYRWIRHPIYAGFLWAFLGLLLLRPNLFFAVYAAGAWILCRIQAEREERFLLERHGAPYAAYMAHTGRFLPRLGAARG